MGDHRSDSEDSRFHDPSGTGADGSVPIDDITGRAVAIVWPLGRAALAVRPRRDLRRRPRRGGRAVSPTGPRRPSLRVERALQRDGHRVLAGMDEVGRGALAGPVTVGVVVIDESCRTAPQGVKDSKLLAPHARERMVPRIERWAVGHAVGHASADEIDEIGIIAALRLAGCRALDRDRHPARPGHPRRQPRLAHLARGRRPARLRPRGPRRRPRR